MLAATDTKSRIIAAAQELFFTYGIRSITMDDIARHLSVSKKTLYRFFNDKSDIVRLLTECDIRDNVKAIKEIALRAKDPIDEILQSMDFMVMEFSRFNPSLIYDLQKYHPDCWNEIKRFSDENMLNTVALNLKKGVKLGIYRSDINIPILSRLRIEQVLMGMNPQVYSPKHFDLKHVQVELIKHFLFGILTQKGNKLLQHHLELRTAQQKKFAKQKIAS